MTWNLWWRFGPWEQRQQAIFDTIRAERPDVVCLQEVWVDGSQDLASIIGSELGYHTLCGATIGGGGVGFAERDRVAVARRADRRRGPPPPRRNARGTAV